MPNRNYRKGYALENKVQNKLKAMGYRVIRSAGSHTPIDLIASLGRHSRRLAIQCKAGNSPFTGADGVELVQWAGFFDAEPVLVQWKGRKTEWLLLRDGKLLDVDERWLRGGRPPFFAPIPPGDCQR